MNEAQLKLAWQTQAQTLPPMSPQEMLAQGSAWQRRIARRNRLEVLAGAFVVVVFCFYIWLFPFWLTRLGSAMVVAGTLAVLWQLRRRASSRMPPADWGRPWFEFQRAELSRQRDALRSVWLWYLGPLLPGMAVFGWSLLPEWRASDALALVALVLAEFGLVFWLNWRAAAKIQREIDALEVQARLQSS